MRDRLHIRVGEMLGAEMDPLPSSDHRPWRVSLAPVFSICASSASSVSLRKPMARQPASVEPAR